VEFHNKNAILPHCKYSCGPAKLLSVKGNAIPLKAWTGPDGSRRVRLPDFKTIGT
jgi:hypothetical protein